MPKKYSSGQITGLLREWGQGRQDAFGKLLPLVNERLRQAAGHYLKDEGPGHPLQTTALVNETYLELLSCKKVRFESRTQFFFLAGRMMRHILVRYARQRLALKRGGGTAHATLDEKIVAHDGFQLGLLELLALDEALDQLKKMDPKQCQIVQLRFFAGMSDPEIAQALGISRRTVQREWHTAKLWLGRELGNRLTGAATSRESTEDLS